MPIFSKGFIRPYSTTLAALFRLMDGAIILSTLELSGLLLSVDWQVNRGLLGAATIALFWFIAEIKSLYQSKRIGQMSNEFVDLLWVWFLSVSILVIVAFLTKTSSQFSRAVIFIWWIVAPVSLVVFRIAVRAALHTLRTHGRNTRTLVFAGAGELAQATAAKIESLPWAGLRIAGVYDDEMPGQVALGSLAYRGSFDQLVADARNGAVDYVYITLPTHAEKRVVSLLTRLADTRASVYVVPDLFLSDLMHARWLTMGEMTLVSVFESPFSGVDGWLKRLEDVLLGSLFLLLSLLPMLIISLGVRLSSPGPVLFRQRRYGLNGEVIEVWKFRTMHVCEDGDSIPQAKPGDSRVTRFGAFLRGTSLDELPQFVNVLQGTMSIVGPRPHAIAHNEQYRRVINGYMLRHKVKPGITGWAQVNGWRGETDTLEKMQRRIECDLAYIRNWSLWLDAKIIWLTIWRGFAGANVY